jgi:hypothetical protein
MKITRSGEGGTKTNNDDRVLQSEIWGSARTTTRAAHASPAAMVAEATRGVETRARKRKRDIDAQAGVAFPAFPSKSQSFLWKSTCPTPRTSRCFAP